MGSVTPRGHNGTLLLEAIIIKKRSKKTTAKSGKATTKRKSKKKAGRSKPKPAMTARNKRGEAKRVEASSPESKGAKRSAIDAAAEVLQRAGKPMRCKELIAAMAEQGLWKSPAGKTPHATLYSAMLRSIATKGTSARFKKVERGLFAFNDKGK